MIGSLFVVSVSLAILLRSQDPHGADFIWRILRAILGYPQDVWPLAIITTAMLVLVSVKSIKKGSGFYLIFAILMPITGSL